MAASTSTGRSKEECVSDVDQLHPWIFLSHSGQEKGFVERLYEALRGANYSPFFDVKSLDPGERFHEPILQAAAGCKLGVVVLSHGFMSSKWPMTELDTMVSASVPIFPVFLRLSPDDLKSPDNLSRWRKAWEARSTNTQDLISHWEALVKDHVSGVIGPVYRGGSELAFIQEIVRGICTRLPPQFSYDVSKIHGSQRLIMVMNDLFELAQDTCHSISNARVIGLHAIGGYGKTTMCKLMVNHYNNMYPGKSSLLEFPSDGDNMEEEIIEACKKAFCHFTRDSNEQISKIHCFDQVMAMMRTRMKMFDVFIAIDNISEYSIKLARAILEVGFSSKSRILMTSRSNAVLRDVMKGCGDTCVAVLPRMEKEEAFHAFQDAFDDDHTSQQLLNRVVKLCEFNGCYHPLALQALGQTLKRTRGDLAPQIEELERAGLGFHLRDIQKLIRRNYESISDVRRQHMFLDVAVLYEFGNLPTFRRTFFDLIVRPDSLEDDDYIVRRDSFEDMWQWLCFLYEKKKQLGKYVIKDCLMQLAYDGLLQLEGVGERKMVKMHDLYRELARSLAAASGHYFVHKGQLNIKPGRKESQWEGLKTIMDSRGSLFLTIVKALQQSACPNLRVLVLASLWNCALDLKNMPCLRVLMLQGKKMEGKNVQVALDLKSMPRLHALVMMDLRLRKVTGWVEAASKLRLLKIQHCEWEQESNSMQVEQQQMTPDRSQYRNACFRVLAEWLSSLYNVNTNLQWLGMGTWLQYLRIETLECCTYKIQQLDLSTLSCLQLFYVRDDQRLEEIMGLSSTSVRVLRLENCPRLSKLKNLSGCERLEEMVVDGCQSLEEIEGMETLLNLHHLQIRGCRSLERLTGLNGSITHQHLERITLDDNSLHLFEGGNVSNSELTLYVEEGFTDQLVHMETLHLGLRSLQNVHHSITSCLKTLHLNVLVTSLIRQHHWFRQLMLVSSEDSSTSTADHHEVRSDNHHAPVSVSLDLSDCARFSHLERLHVKVHLYSWSVSIELLQHLDLTALSHLAHLKISCFYLKEIAGFSLPPSLQSLDLSGCRYHDKPSTINSVLDLPDSCILIRGPR